jgi:hypothetical protein
MWNHKLEGTEAYIIQLVKSYKLKIHVAETLMMQSEGVVLKYN